MATAAKKIAILPVRKILPPATAITSNMPKPLSSPPLAYINRLSMIISISVWAAICQLKRGARRAMNGLKISAASR